MESNKEKKPFVPMAERQGVKLEPMTEVRDSSMVSEPVVDIDYIEDNPAASSGGAPPSGGGSPPSSSASETASNSDMHDESHDNPTGQPSSGQPSSEQPSGDKGGGVKGLPPKIKKDSTEKTAEIASKGYQKMLPELPKMLAKYSPRTLRRLQRDFNVNPNSVIVVNTEAGQQAVTIAGYVNGWNAQCDQIFRIDDEQREEFREAFYDFLEEKEIAASPTMRLIAVVGMHVVGMGVMAFGMRSNRLEDMKDWKYEAEQKRKQNEATYVPPPPPSSPPSPKPEDFTPPRPSAPPPPPARPVEPVQPVEPVTAPVQTTPTAPSNGQVKKEEIIVDADTVITEVPEDKIEVINPKDVQEIPHQTDYTIEE